MKLILILRCGDKQKADSPCEEIRISGEIENEAKAYKAFRSQKCKAFRSQSFSFCSQNGSFCSQSVSFRPRSVPFRANRSAFPWCSSTLQGLYMQCSPWCKIQNYYLYLQGITNSELCTRQN